MIGNELNFKSFIMKKNSFQPARNKAGLNLSENLIWLQTNLFTI